MRNSAKSELGQSKRTNHAKSLLANQLFDTLTLSELGQVRPHARSCFSITGPPIVRAQ